MKKLQNSFSMDGSILADILENYGEKIRDLRLQAKESPESSELLQNSDKLISIGGDLREELTNITVLTNRVVEMVNATHTPILSLDKNLRVQQFTAAVTEILNIDESDKGKPLSDILDCSTFIKLNNQIEKIFERPMPAEIECYLKKDDQWFLTRILPYPPQSDEIKGAVIVFINQTKEKKHEEKLTQLNRTLELQVQRQNKKVKKLASELIVAEQKERKRIAVLLHNNLQQQLFSIQTNVKLLGDEIPAEFNTKIKKISSQLDNSLKLTHQLVVNLSPPNIKDNDLYKGIKWLCRYMYNFHGLRVESKEVKRTKIANKDKLVLLLQMIQELLFNIVKHANVDKAKIKTKENKMGLQICVIDQGKGFDKKEVDHLQSVGLSQIKDQIELLGGCMNINSTPNLGTVICLTLPKENYSRINGHGTISLFNPDQSMS